MLIMPKSSAATAAQARAADLASPLAAVVIDIDEVAARRERLLAYAQATRPVVVYRFVLPAGATVAPLDGGAPRDARNLLYALVGLTGGAIAKSHEGLAARIPKISAAKFERLAGPLVAAYLVSLDLGA